MVRKKSKRSKKEQKIILRILALVLLAIILPVTILKIFESKIMQPEIFETQTALSGPSLVFDPKSLTISPGEEFAIDVLLDTTGETVSAVDILVYFDPAYLTFLRAQKGTIEKLPHYPIIGKINSEEQIKLLSISAINFNPNDNTFTNGYTSQTNPGVLTTLKFKATNNLSLNTTTNLSFKFTTSLTNDSNIVKKDTDQDILNFTNQSNITINIPQSPSPTSIPSPTPKPNPSKTQIYYHDQRQLSNTGWSNFEKNNNVAGGTDISTIKDFSFHCNPSNNCGQFILTTKNKVFYRQRINGSWSSFQNVSSEFNSIGGVKNIQGIASYCTPFGCGQWVVGLEE